MKYRRVMLLLELGADPAAALASARHLAPGAQRLVVVVTPPVRPAPSWWSGAAPPEPDPASDHWLDDLRGATGDLAKRVEVTLLPELDLRELGEIVAEGTLELVIGGPAPAALGALSGLRRRHPIASLWIGDSAASGADRPLATLLCFALGSVGIGAIASFLRTHCDQDQQVKLVTLARHSRDELDTVRKVAGIDVEMELVGAVVGLPWLLDELARARSVDLLVLARFPAALLRRAPWPVPILVLPWISGGAPALSPLDAPDLIDDRGVLRVRLGDASGLGRNPPIPDQAIAFVSRGRLVAIVSTEDGAAELPPGLREDSFGLFRVGDREAVPDLVAAIERHVAVVRPETRPLVLFDPDIPDRRLLTLSESASRQGFEPLAVRMRPTATSSSIRERLREAGLRPRVVDASAVLDEGDVPDVGEALDSLRLARVGAHMLGAGFPVAAVLFHGAYRPSTSGFAALRIGELEAGSWDRHAEPPATTLDAGTVAEPLPGNQVELEVDNSTARRWLLSAISGATRRVHLQIYMVTDDDLGRLVERELAEAGRRGVSVRVLADSLRCLHGSFGMRNALLERLSSSPGVEVRASRPVSGVPSLDQLKQRDHRKLLVVDGRVALVGGRNLGDEYYTGFGEAEITPRTPWRDVPWLDAGARVEGPAVAAIERAFLEAWTDTGGAPFEIQDPGPAGQTSVRVVVHRGLRDARTLETYLALVEGARSHVYAVNGFPLLLEIQHALIRALRRGVKVRALFGHVTPTHGDQPFEGQWAAAGSVATWLVHSRMDALVAAGAEGYQFAVREAGWAPELGLVRPHVHAKIMSVDGRVCTVGSANLDITASYWESELMLVIEDPARTRALEARLDEITAVSVKVDREDPAWQRLARRREWLRRWPGVLSV